MTYRSNHEAGKGGGVLADFIKSRVVDATIVALDSGVDVEDALVAMLREPEFLSRVFATSPDELLKVLGELQELIRGLQVLEFLPHKLNIAEPPVVQALLNEAAATLIATADEALAESAGDADPPSQSDLAAWMGAGHVPPETLAEVEKRLAAVWGLDPLRVRVTGWGVGGLVTRHDGVELHVPAADLVAEVKRRQIPNPLATLVRACPVHGKANLRPDRILSARLAMVDPADRRAGSLFSPAAHRRGQLVMPGFELADHEGPALPLALYQLGEDNPLRGGGRGAALALRLFVEAILAAPYDQRHAGQPVALQVTLRDLLDRLYPGPRKPRPNEYWPRLMRAVEALDTMDARIPWQDPNTGRGELRRVVSMGGIPRGPGALDDVVRMVVDLPPGSGPGPMVTPTLGAWGARSAPAYHALLNLAYRWFDPGVTRHPVGGGHWLQVQDPERYPALSDADVVAITRPLSTRAERSHLVGEGWETLRELEDAGELRIEGRRVLPPGRGGKSDVHPSDE